MRSLAMPSTSTLYLDEYLHDRADDSRERLDGAPSSQRDADHVPVRDGVESTAAEVHREGCYAARSRGIGFLGRNVANKGLLCFLIAVIVAVVVVAIAVPLTLVGKESPHDR